MMERTWKLKGRGIYNKERVMSSKYFIKHNCVSCGWGQPAIDFSEKIIDIETYKKYWDIMYSHEKKWGNQGIHQLLDNVKKGDYLWTRLDGVYYLAQVSDNPDILFHIDLSQEAKEFDCVVQLKNIFWKRIGTEEAVPGSISTFTSNRNSIVKVDNQEVWNFNYSATSLLSSMIYHEKKIEKIKEKRLLYSFIGPSGFEDIVALWLYDKFNYVVIPSTNKKSTQTYEFVMFDGTKLVNNQYSDRRIYLQTKNGRVDLKIADYIHLLENDKDEVWLVTHGNVFDLNGEELKGNLVKVIGSDSNLGIESYSLDVLTEFVFDKDNTLIPNIIRKYTELFET